ncbi:MAG: DUF1449 family protein [Polyangiaceae bacterium]|nr:DUF1449 family protein [Polyangiaceae bacterium]
MTFLSSLLTWANVPFVVALGVAVSFVLLQVSGLLGLLAGDHGGDGDHEADADANADADASADADADADADGDADADADADGNGHPAPHPAAAAGKEILTGMGFGTMPLSIVWQAFAVCFALGGITANTVYLSVTRALPTSALAISFPIAAVFAYVATRLVSKVFGRLAPAAGKTSVSRRDLIGKSAVVISSKVSDEFGEVRLTDSSGIVHRVICRVMPGESSVSEGREVVFVDYDRERDHLFVAPLDVDAPPNKRRVGTTARVRVKTPADPDESGAEDGVGTPKVGDANRSA